MTDDELDAIRRRKRDRLLADADAQAPDETESAPDHPINVDDIEGFSEITTDYGVVVVDFYADWCGPCKALEPTVAAVAANTDAAVAKVDVDEHRGLAAQYGVRSVPTLLVFADGAQVERVVGAHDESALTTLVERHA